MEYTYRYDNVKDLVEKARLNLMNIDRDKLTYSDGFEKWKGGWKLKFIESKVVQRIFFILRIDYWQHKFSSSYKKEVKRAFDDYLTDNEKRNQRLLRNIEKDIRICDRLIMAKPYEYFFFDLRNKSKENRKTFVTDKYMLQKMSIIDSRRNHDIELNDKYNFYLLATPFFKRKVFLLNENINFESVKDELIRCKKMIFKPIAFGCGQGIFIAETSSLDAVRNIYDKIKEYGGSWVGEELISQCNEMAIWNATSVNSVRLLSFNTSNGVKFVTSFFRTGRAGSVVDNGGSGGIFAAIDVIKGELMSDGKDEKGNTYVYHPDSKIKYRGWKIPRWEELKETAIALHSEVFPKMKYVGWDFALTEDGWVVIEGNWGQFLQQAASNVGLRPEFDKFVK